MAIFINFTNHSSDKWSEEQINSASQYGNIVDISFPSVPAFYDEEQIQQTANAYSQKILDYFPAAVLCQGEFTLVFAVVNTLLKHGITVLSACSDRITTETILPDGTLKKISNFKFVKFRKYV